MATLSSASEVLTGGMGDYSWLCTRGLRPITRTDEEAVAVVRDSVSEDFDANVQLKVLARGQIAYQKTR